MVQLEAVASLEETKSSATTFGSRWKKIMNDENMADKSSLPMSK
jgi:hypothetical protein